MAGVGRKIGIYLGTVVDPLNRICTARQKGFTINNEAVDTSSDCDDAWQTMADEPGAKSVEFTVEGVGNHEALLDVSLSTTDVTQELCIDYGTYTVSGNFFMASYAEGLPYKEVTTFTGTFASNGEVTKTATP